MCYSKTNRLNKNNEHKLVKKIFIQLPLKRVLLLGTAPPGEQMGKKLCQSGEAAFPALGLTETAHTDERTIKDRAREVQLLHYMATHSW